jgi:hypothetical protein
MVSVRSTFGKRYPQLAREGLRSRYAPVNTLPHPIRAYPTRSLRAMASAAQQPRLLRPGVLPRFSERHRSGSRFGLWSSLDELRSRTDVWSRSLVCDEPVVDFSDSGLRGIREI